MKKSFLFFLSFITFSLVSFAQQTTIKGSVLDGTTGEPIPDVTITIEETGQSLKTDAKGEFSFTQNVPLGEQVLKIEKVEYVTKRYPIIVNEGQTVDISGMTLDFDTSDKKDLFVISISDDNLNGEDDGLTDNVSGLLQASRDVFLSAAAFDFSAAFFRPRGLDNANGKVLINGVEMNKQFNGRPQWGNWGGLNDVQRNQEFTMGLAANDYNFGDLAGTNNIVMRASRYREGGRISYASANRSYQGRIMASYSSGLLKGGWSYSVLGSRRFGEEGFVDGTLYDANSFFVAVEKQINEKHSLNFTGIYAQNRRGRSTAITQEIHDLKGRKYNPFWGMQDGEQRNSRMREINEPILMLNHFWKISDNVRLNTNVAYQFGEFADTRIDFFGTRFDEENGQLYGGARNPTPEYWQNLPSFFLASPNPSTADYASAYFAQQEFLNDGQLDWTEFYDANIRNGYNIYALQANVVNDNQLTVNTILDAELSDNIRINGNINYRRLNSENFARIEDLLGGPGYLDVNLPFNDGEGFGQSVDIFAQSNIRTPNRIVGEGDKYSYHYDINANVLSSFVQAQFKYNRVDFYLGGTISNTTYQREGFYENGYFTNNNPNGIVGSFGKSDTADFTNYGIKAGATIKVTGKHLIDINANHFTKAPGIRASFANARQNNLLVRDLESETINSIDASYIFRSPILKARLTGYFTTFENGTEVNFFFTESVGNLTQEIAQNINRQNYGAELGIEAQITPTIKLKGAAAMGQFTYTNNPNVYYSSDRFVDLTFGDGTAEMEDYRVASGPERVFQVGFEYRDPDYWNFGVTTNFFSHTYVDPSFLKRSAAFAQDPDTYDLDEILASSQDGVVNISGFGVADYDEEVARGILRQERFEDYMLVNLTGGKSWKINDYFVGFFATVNNVFNQNYRTGGFEQARRLDYRSQIEEQTNTGGPIFGNRYFFGNGTTYYLNVYVRF
ncbi:TonB-dependent receptor [Winogradskyella sp. J14-2]|uniref:TonB-dependent receptor n=1 Tax=Winogradskyella sp. J14-2 TaxID=1936080 RepID=UPI000972B7E7|nr:TonB-dependent receptor [Winogradskyella sp. J14-2]APY08304.1 TonB-dependent receptor [Winogradskyella sp. J14-2]